MKKIINGKMYDTETAKCVGTSNNGLNGNDFRHCSESLYRKKNGEFFLHGSGGPMTQYRESVGDMWASGEKIIPLSEGEAREWAEENLSADTYIEIFGEVEE